MGSAGSALVNGRHLKVEHYKWSSEEFPQEHALICTALEYRNESSIFRLSVSPNKVLCRVADYFCRDPPNPVRIRVQVSAERNTNGDFDFRKVEVVAARTNKNRSLRQGHVICEYYKYFTLIQGYCAVYREYNRSVFYHGNLNKTIWKVAHNYSLGGDTDHRFEVDIQCNKETGLCVEFRAPFKWRMDSGKRFLQIDREVEGEPPKGYIEEVKNEFQGEVFTLFKKPKDNNRNGTKGSTCVQSSTTGHVSNIGAEFHGNGNGSFYHHCQFNCNAPHPS